MVQNICSCVIVGSVTPHTHHPHLPLPTPGPHLSLPTHTHTHHSPVPRTHHTTLPALLHNPHHSSLTSPSSPLLPLHSFGNGREGEGEAPPPRVERDISPSKRSPTSLMEDVRQAVMHADVTCECNNNNNNISVCEV